VTVTTAVKDANDAKDANDVTVAGSRA